MLLPTKRITTERSLIGVGADVLQILEEPKTVSRVWEELSDRRRTGDEAQSLTFDWFVLALDVLYSLGTITVQQGTLHRHKLT